VRAGGHGDDLLVLPRLVLHEEHADRAHAHHGARRDRAGVRDEHVAGVAVARERVRDEAVIARVAHRRVEEAVDDERARRFVHLVLDRLAADRHLDDDVHVVRRVRADRDGVDAHGSSHESQGAAERLALIRLIAPRSSRKRRHSAILDQRWR
jgi:hypothetical protein